MRSGWCTGPTNARPDCDGCRSAGCECPGCAQKRAVERDSAWERPQIEGQMCENRSGPEGAETPESLGLTCITRPNRGARL